jgi:dTMP kinase
VTPRLTLLLDCPVRLGLQRARGHDRFHAELEAFHERVRQGFTPKPPRRLPRGT